MRSFFKVNILLVIRCYKLLFFQGLLVCFGPLFLHLFGLLGVSGVCVFFKNMFVWGWFCRCEGIYVRTAADRLVD